MGFRLEVLEEELQGQERAAARSNSTCLARGAAERLVDICDELSALSPRGSDGVPRLPLWRVARLQLPLFSRRRSDNWAYAVFAWLIDPAACEAGLLVARVCGLAVCCRSVFLLLFHRPPFEKPLTASTHAGFRKQ